jgi:hypothetical protein
MSVLQASITVDSMAKLDKLIKALDDEIEKAQQTTVDKTHINLLKRRRKLLYKTAELTLGASG